MLSKKDFPEYDGLYYVGDLVDVDGDGWVDEETVELIIEELNVGVMDNVTFAVPGRKEVVYRPVMPEDKYNWIHLN